MAFVEENIPNYPFDKTGTMSRQAERDRPAAKITREMVLAAKEVLHASAGDDLGQIADEDSIIVSMIRAAFAASPSSSQE